MVESTVGKLRQLFEKAVDLPPEEQDTFIKKACGNNRRLQNDLRDMLQRDRTASGRVTAFKGLIGGLLQEAVSEAIVEGQHIGPFRIEEMIGSGGMGCVFRVTRIDGQFSQEAALKLVRPFALNPRLLSRFSNERRVHAALDHPGICRFLDAGTLLDDQPYVLMELIHGTPIINYCDHRKLNIRERLELFSAVLEAVAYAHHKLVIHRDIKSNNVLVTDQGLPKLLDFGIAKDLSLRDVESTQTVDHFFSPISAAPEQFTGDPVGVGCDIYSLGQLLYELLSGARPFDLSGCSAGTVERIISEDPPPPMSSKLLSGGTSGARNRGFNSQLEMSHSLKGDLDLIVLKCLRKDPEERYSSVGELRQDIKRVLENRPIASRNHERWYRFRKFLIRNRIPVTLGAALALTIVTLFGVIGAQSISLGEERNRAVAERDKANHAVALLREAFVAADPARIGGGQVTAREILLSARPPLEDLRDRQPELYVRLSSVIAEVELALGLNDLAAATAKRGISVGGDVGMSSEDMRILKLLKGKALTDSGYRKEAHEALKKVRAIDFDEQPDWLIAMGRLLLHQGQPDEAIQFLERALNRVEGGGADSEEAVIARWHLGQALSFANRHQESVDMFSEMLARMDQELGEGHPRTTLTRLWRVDALRRAGYHSQAMDEVGKVQEFVISAYGAKSAMAGRAYAAAGLLAAAMQNNREAELQYRNALQVWEHVLGPNHPNTLRTTFNLAQVLEILDPESPEIERLLRSGLAASEAQYLNDSGMTMRFRRRLARHLAAYQRWDEAYDALAGAHESSDADLGSESRRRHALAEFYQLVGCDDSDVSEDLMNRCLDIAESLGDP